MHDLFGSVVFVSLPVAATAGAFALDGDLRVGYSVLTAATRPL